jgi:hypothetical protein
MSHLRVIGLNCISLGLGLIVAFSLGPAVLLVIGILPWGSARRSTDERRTWDTATGGR